eukprot:scaffold3992_cov141-Skeletonema_dohrnii-CCMP3373.AAC.4
MMTTAFSFSSTNSAITSTTRGGIRKQHHPFSTSTSSSEEEVWNRAAEEIDPYSEEAKLNLSNFYKRHNIDSIKDAEKDHKKLLRLTEQVLSWNQRLNLISRKDCTPEVVYHRHILPSIALMPLVLKSSHDDTDDNNNNNNNNNNNSQPLKIVDVGTGGGFPGLPLALLLPHCEFTLVDSIQKKLVAVSEMAAELDVENVRIHCGRCEEMYAEREGRMEHLGKYDVCLGRSVTALPRFCAWMYPLLKKQQQQDGDGEEGRLIYIIGGELEDVVESRIQSDTYLDELLDREEGTSDKRALIFMANDVEEIAFESGEVDKIVRSAPAGTGKKSKKKKNQQQRTNKVAKGAWQKRDNSVKKERGYDDFQRFEF